MLSLICHSRLVPSDCAARQVCPALLYVREQDPLASMLSLIRTFPHITSLKLLEVPLQCHLPLPCLKAALNGWPQLRKLGLLAPNVSYLLEGERVPLPRRVRVSAPQTSCVHASAAGAVSCWRMSRVLLVGPL